MTKAIVNGIECTIYDFINWHGFSICRVKYPMYDGLFPGLAELIEVSYGG